MRKSKYSETQLVAILGEVEAGLPVTEVIAEIPGPPYIATIQVEGGSRYQKLARLGMEASAVTQGVCEGKGTGGPSSDLRIQTIYLIG